MRVYYKPICCVEEGQKSRGRLFFREILYRFSNYIVLTLCVITLLTLYLIGIFNYFTEEDFASFNYPKEVSNLRGIIDKLDQFHSKEQKENLLFGINKLDYYRISDMLKRIKIVDNDNKPLEPLTQFSNYNFSLDIEPTCQKQWGLNQVGSTLLSVSSPDLNKITIIIIVKSAVNNYLRRNAIRKSWYLNIGVDIFLFKTVFIVGKCHERNRKPYSTEQFQYNSSWSVNDCEEKISTESRIYGDIIQSSGIDSYYNNTIKTFMTYKWVTERCPSDFILTLDDDYVFEVDNFIKYLYKLTHVNIPILPQQLNKSQDMELVPSVQNLTHQYLSLKNLYQESDAVKLHSLRFLSHQFIWAGYLRNYVHPLRIVFSKWYITRREYAYDKYPPFVTGGAVLMSFKTIKYFYYATYFTNSFKFDDVYIGITAYKLGIPALHSDEFMCNLEDYLDAKPIQSNATNCIGVHDIESTKLIELWATRSKQAQL